MQETGYSGNVKNLPGNDQLAPETGNAEGSPGLMRSLDGVSWPRWESQKGDRAPP
jgi:hypothetical protein